MAVFSRVGGRDLPRAVRAQGAEVWDAEGRRYLDASGGAVVVGIGHGRPEVADAMARQAREVAYVHGTQFTTAALQDYAARLTAHLPGGWRLYPVAGGSEANETAFKLARAYHLARGDHGRFKVLHRVPSYHGNTLGTLTHSGRASLRAPYAPLLGSAPSAPAPYCYRCALGRTFPECALACADEIEAAIVREGPSTVAAVIAEPVLGASAGAAVPPDGYDARLREICSRHGVLLIADEVMTGFGRTGRFFAFEWGGSVPDVITCGKGMSSGYLPAGGVLAREEIYAAVAASGFVHGFTFSHHPVVAAACAAVLDVLEREGLVARAAAAGERLGRILAGLRGHPHVGDVRGRGLLHAVELVADRATKAAFPRGEKRLEKLLARAFGHGLILYPGTGMADGVNGEVAMVAPPLVVSDAQIDEIGAVLDRSLSEEAL